MKLSELSIPQNTVIGAWRLHDRLGAGGQGMVWSAKPVKTKRTPARALKICFSSEEQARARFRREVELLLLCDSPHVLRVHDHDLAWKEHIPGSPPFAYYVSEKCQGSLEERQGDLGDARMRLALFRHACEAVAYLHSLPEPVIHRDIKPGNFLVSGELGNLVLADFGIARHLADSALTEAFEVVGTPYFRAPEVSNGERGSVQSDVYGLGRLLEWMLTGDVSRDLGTRPVPRGTDLDDEACDVFDRIIAKATQVRAANRFGSVPELVEQLPELWLSAKPRPRLSLPLESADAGRALNVALELARTNDTLGWRQLESQLREKTSGALLEWSQRHQHDLANTKDGRVRATDSLLEAAEARFMLPLASAYSNKSSVGEVRRAIEDLNSLPNWPSSGLVAVIDAPRTLVYLLHYVHGALCLSYQQLEAALQVAEIPIVVSRRGEDVDALWRCSEVTGYPELLGRDAAWAWEYLCGLRARRPFLKQMFALESDYELGLACYSLTLSLVELAADAAQPKPTDLTGPHVRLYVAPLIVRMKHETIAAAARRVSGNRAVVQTIADRFGAKLSVMQELWPAWKQVMGKYRGQDRYYWGDLPLGELAVP